MLNYNGDVWYGEYGGCFISDAFTLSCDNYYKEFQRAIGDEEFQSDYDSLKKRYGQEQVCFARDEEHHLLICQAPENYGSILGTALLGKYLGKSAVCGARYPDEAVVCAQVCRDLGIKVHIILGREVSHIKTLTDYLTGLGASCDVKTCCELFNLPEMYAFQAWVSEPDSRHLINCRSNVGAYPQTNIAAAFAADYRRDLARLAAQAYPKVTRVVMPAVSGSDALAIMTAMGEREYVCVECDTEQGLTEELDSYCGSLTKVMRNPYVDRVLAAELVSLVEAGKAARVHISPEEAMSVKTEKQLSVQSLGALRYGMSQPDDGTTLVITRGVRWGGAV